MYIGSCATSVLSNEVEKEKKEQVREIYHVFKLWFMKIKYYYFWDIILIIVECQKIDFFSQPLTDP